MAEALAAFWGLVPVTLAQGLLYGFVALAVMVPFRLLDFPDLTSEGAFPLGGCLCAALIAGGVHPAPATLLAVGGGFLAGCATALIHQRLRVNSLLAGILVLTMLWSVDLRVMGKSNTPLFALPNLFDGAWDGFTQDVAAQVVLWGALALATVLALRWFLRTEAGLAVRCVGANAVMARAQGVRVARTVLVGVGAAGATAAFAGAAVAQVQGYADVGMGFGILVSALASLIIGEALVGRATPGRQAAAPFVGSVVYYQAVSAGLAAGVHPSDLKLVTGLFVLATLALPLLRHGGAGEPGRRGA